MADVVVVLCEIAVVGSKKKRERKRLMLLHSEKSGQEMDNTKREWEGTNTHRQTFSSYTDMNV